MKGYLVFLSIVPLTLFVFCTSVPKENIYGTYDSKTLLFYPETYEFQESKVFGKPFNEVWSAVMDILYESDMLIESTDKTTGVISLQEWITTDTLVETRYCDCGSHSLKVRKYGRLIRKPQRQLDDPRTAHTAFYITAKDSVHTQVRILNEFHISYATQPSLAEKWLKHGVAGLAETRYPEFWKCESTGKLESQFFQMIDIQLSKNN